MTTHGYQTAPVAQVRWYRAHARTKRRRCQPTPLGGLNPVERLVAGGDKCELKTQLEDQCFVREPLESRIARERAQCSPVVLFLRRDETVKL